MSVDIRLPNITGRTDAEQLQQIKSYLYQFASQLQWAFSTVESGNGSSTKVLEQKQIGNTPSDDRDIANFNQLKSLIIKTAEVVNVYSEKLEKLIDLDGEYYAESPFGTFIENTNNRIDATEKDVKQSLDNYQAIFDENGNIKAELLVNGHIYSGIIEYAKSGEAIVGIEIGQTTDVNGVQKFNKFARFTADRLSFYDANSIEVAYISDYKLVITQAHIKGTLEMGSYFKFDTTNGIALIPV